MSAEEERDRAIALAESHADEVWKGLVQYAIRELARTHSTFTSEAVWHFMEERFPDFATHERRAMGPMMQGAAKDGLIAPTDEFVKGERPSRHAAPIRVWRSLWRYES